MIETIKFWISALKDKVITAYSRVTDLFKRYVWVLIGFFGLYTTIIVMQATPGLVNFPSVLLAYGFVRFIWYVEDMINTKIDAIEEIKGGNGAYAIHEVAISIVVLACVLLATL